VIVQGTAQREVWLRLIWYRTTDESLPRAHSTSPTSNRGSKPKGVCFIIFKYRVPIYSIDDDGAVMQTENLQIIMETESISVEREMDMVRFRITTIIIF